MELEELKASWTELDNRLKKSEALNEALVLDMMRNRAQMSVGKLISLESKLLIIPIIFLIKAIYTFTKPLNVHVLGVVMEYVQLVMFGVMFVATIYNITLLKRIDVAKSVRDNIYNLNRFNVVRKRGSFILLVMLVIFCALFLWIVLLGGSLIALIFIAVFVLGVAGLLYWGGKRDFYQKKVDSILESLNEIKDLEEQE